MARINMTHDGMQVVLGPGIPTRWLLAWLVLAAVSAFGVVIALARAPTLWAPPLLLAGTSIVMAVRTLNSRQRMIHSDGKTVTLPDGRVRSLLDIRVVTVASRRLVFDPVLGPLQPFTAGPFRETDEELKRVADVINTAIEQAQSRRGDAPGKDFYAMNQVLKQSE